MTVAQLDARPRRRHADKAAQRARWAYSAAREHLMIHARRKRWSDDNRRAAVRYLRELFFGVPDGASAVEVTDTVRNEVRRRFAVSCILNCVPRHSLPGQNQDWYPRVHAIASAFLANRPKAAKRTKQDPGTTPGTAQAS